jgi:hypothetical protein
MLKKTFLLFVICLITVVSLTPVIAEDVGVLFSSDIVYTNDLDEDIANESVNSTDLSNNNTNDTIESNDNSNNTTNDTFDNYNQFKKEWTDFVSTTEYERYNGHKKSYKQIEKDKSFNCYDGAYYTIFLATKYGLKSEIVHGFWDGVGHGAVRVYKQDGTSEMFDTAQYQKGYGRNGLENYIYWDKIDRWSTNEAKTKANKIIESGFVRPIDLDSVYEQDIANIYLHSNVLDKYSEDQVQEFIKKCHDKKIKVHLWITVFRYDGKFNVPNNVVINGRLDLIKKCSDVPNIDGVNLDYIRYDGKNPSIVNEDLITDFVKQTREITKSKGLELSICLMPEKEQVTKLYGQNTKELSKYCDVIMPMIYKGNYNKDTKWITETTRYYKNISECKVAPIILTYKSDKDTTKLSIEELKGDIRAVYEGGADGCSLFKYGYVDVIL